MSLGDAIRNDRLLVTAGAGGVGKTTVAAALGVRTAIAGRRVAVLTIDPARRLANALGLDQLTGELRRVEPACFTEAGLQPAAGALWAMMLDTKTTGDQMVRRFAPDAAAANAILRNDYYRFFSTSLAGAQEYMAIEQVRALVQDGDFDLVVLDTPPAVHALDFLDAPDRLLGALDSKAVQLLRRTQNGNSGSLAGRGRSLLMKSLNRLTGGGFLDDLASFLGLFATILEALRVASGELHRLLRADGTRFLLVTTPTGTNIDDAAHFRHELGVRGFPFGGFIANRVHARMPDVTLDEAALLRAMGDTAAAGLPVDRQRALLARMVAGLKSHQRMAERDRRAIERLVRVGEARPEAIPLFPRDISDLGGLDQVGRCLTG